jgi:hypothetical protein
MLIRHIICTNSVALVLSALPRQHLPANGAFPLSVLRPYDKEI